MAEERRFLIDVGIKDLPFPMRVISRDNPEGQYTLADISINARIIQEFEASWIDKFIRILHRHRDRIGTKTLGANIVDYLNELKATMVRVDFSFPFFIEKLTPVSKEKCLVRYQCMYSVKIPSLDNKPKITFQISIPCITTYPGSTSGEPGNLFGQLSVVVIETESRNDIYPEDLVEIVDKHSLAPIFSFLTQEDQAFIIEKIHSERKSSTVVIDEIGKELSHNRDIDWFSVRGLNYGMLHSYSTIIGTEKTFWVPFGSSKEEKI
jgi:GTP cyclohydrolase IB